MLNRYRYAITNFFISTLWIFFAYNNLSKFIETYNLTLIVLFISESITVILFLIRERPKSTSLDPWDWFCAISGTFATLLFIPSATSTTAFGVPEIVVTLGMILQIIGLVSINTSFGIVPAHRTIKTQGLYKFVRHPIYLSYLLVIIGYFIANISMWNILIFIISISFLLLRIINEERYLFRDKKYQEYTEKTRWRLFPYIF